MDEIKTVVCVDNFEFFKYKNRTYHLNKESFTKGADKVIFWGSKVAEVSGGIATAIDASDKSHPQEFINVLKNCHFKYRLIITVVGKMDIGDIKICDEIIKQSNILDNIVDFQIYYYGEKLAINMEFHDLFTSKKFKKEIILNGCQLYCIDINIDFDKLTYLKDISDLKCDIISLTTKFPEDKTVVRCKIDKLFYRLSKQYQKKKSLRLYFENNDVEGCIRFIERSSYNLSKKLLQQKIKDLLNLIDNPIFHFVLRERVSVELKPEEQFDVLDEDSETDDGGITCDITFNKCKQLCLLVREMNENIISEELDKQIFHNPFLLLKHTDIVKKMLNLVEYQQIDITSWIKLRNNYVSPFTRQPIIGIYIFNSGYENVDFDMLMKNNSSILSEIFGNDYEFSTRLDLRQVVFLYMLMKFHPKWKNEPEIIKKEIKYICDHTFTHIGLFHNLEPYMYDQLSIALWYVVNVSHKLYPNSPNNVLRNIGESSTYILDFYSDVFHSVDEELYNKTKVWAVWSYMVRNKGNKRKLSNEILAQYQKYREIEGFLIFFSGRCEKRYECILNILPVEKVLGLYHILHENSGEFDEIDHVRDHNPRVNFINTSEPSCRKHVEISLETCQAVIVCCSKTEHQCRKKCAVDHTDYFDTFHEFCVVNGKYPKNEYELIVSHSLEHYKTSSGIVVYPVHGLEDFRLVMKKFDKVTKTYVFEDYLELSTECKWARKRCSHKRPYWIDFTLVKRTLKN